MTDTSGSTTWKYDTRGRVIEETKVITSTGGGTFKTQWTYNSADLVVDMKYPGGNGGEIGETVTTAYDKWGRPNTLAGSNTYVSSATYDVFDRLDVVQFGNGQRTDYDYYPMTQKGGRLYEIKTGPTSPYTGTQHLRYDYDSAGNVTLIKDYRNVGQAQCFQHDALDRVTRAFTGNDACTAYDGSRGADVYDQSYTYTTIGNINTFAGVQYGYQDSGHKHAVTHLAGVQKYWYDANGNMTTRAAGSTYTLTYDNENRLTNVTATGLTATFLYDGDGNRVKATVGVTTTVYVGTYFEAGTTWAKYYYFNGLRVAMRDSNGVRWIHGDHLGSAMRTTDSGGSPSDPRRYYPYGGKRNASGAELATPYRFTGQREESTIGLYFYNARWYDAALGRFTQPDTLVPEPGNPQALNRYAYVLNNPVRYTDPSGHVHDPYEGAGSPKREVPASPWPEAVDRVASLLGIGVGDSTRIADLDLTMNVWFAKVDLSYEATVTGNGPERLLTIANTYQKIGPWKQTADGDLRVQTLPVESSSDKAQASGVLEFGVSQHPSFSSVRFSVGAETTCELRGSNVNPGLEQVLTVSAEIRPNRVALVGALVVSAVIASEAPWSAPGLIEGWRRAIRVGL